MELLDAKGNKSSPSLSTEDGVTPGDSGKHRLKLKWHWHWKKKNSQPPQVAQFSHDPPGHTCGLPCCIQDNEPTQVLQRKSHSGCVTVPILSQADLSDSNFIMKRKQFPLDTPMGKKTLLRRSNEYGDKRMSDCDDETEGNERALRNICLSNSSDVTPFKSMIGERKNMCTNKAPEKPNQEKQHILSLTEQIRQRHITLPDCPQTQHTIMFLNHQPGETSDFSDFRSTNHQVFNRQEIRDDSTEDSLSLSQLNVEDENVSENNELSTFENKSDLILPDEGYHQERDFTETSRKKRLVHSKLPEVPIESADSGLAFEQEFRQVSPEVDDDDVEDNLSVYVDHVYDVPSDVKDSAFLFAQASSTVKPGSTSDFLSPVSAANVPQYKPSLPRSVSELTLSEIEGVTFPVEDNESVYNGSLLSFATNDSDVSLIYPSVLARHRYLMGHADYTTSLLRRKFFGSKLDQLSLSSTEKEAQPDLDNVSTASITNETDNHTHGIGVNLTLPKPCIKVDEYDMSVRLPSKSRLGFFPSASSEFDIDSNTKLKLWDLRLSTASQEQNDYSTFPLRMFPSDDVNFGYFSSSQDLACVQNNNDTLEKMSSYLDQSSVLSSNIRRDNTALYFLSLNQISPFLSQQPNFIKSNPSINEWKQLFDTNSELAVGAEPSPSSGSQMPASWSFPWKEESEHEPVVFSGIYDLHKSGQASKTYEDNVASSSKCLQRTRPDVKPLDMQLTEDESTPNPTITFDPDNSIYASYTYFGGSVSCSTSSFSSFAKRSTAGGSVSFESKGNNRSGTPGSGRTQGSRQNPVSPLTRTDPSQDKQTVIMTNGKTVDWRRQAEFYRENNFITLIL